MLRLRTYLDHGEALRAAGLTPDLVERWQKAAEAYARHDLHTAMRFYAPDAVWDGSSAEVGAYFEGATAIRSFLEDWIGPFEENEYNQAA